MSPTEVVPLGWRGFSPSPAIQRSRLGLNEHSRVLLIKIDLRIGLGVAWSKILWGVDTEARTAVVDTVGVGETFGPRVLASLKMKNLLTKAQVASLREDQIAKVAKLCAAAAAVTSPAGANPPWLYEIVALVDLISGAKPSELAM